jgi:hypothetical protein
MPKEKISCHVNLYLPHLTAYVAAEEVEDCLEAAYEEFG